MRSMGIRVSPKTIYYTIFDDTFDNEKYNFLVNKLRVPEALHTPNKLRFIRTNLQSIIAESQVTNVGLRLTENSAQTINHFRLNTEGVIQELIANTFVNTYFSGTLSVIAKHLKCELKQLQEDLASDTFSNIAGWEKFPKEVRESIVVALAAKSCTEENI